MPITGTLQEYEEHLSSEFIGSTLSAVNDDFVQQFEAQKTSTSIICPYLDRVEGLSIAAGTFPNVTISAGSITDPSGNVYKFSSTSVAPTAVANAEYRVYVDSSYQIGVGVTVPVGARLQLGVVKHNEFGTGFAQIIKGPFEDISFIDPTTEDLVKVEVYNGSIQLMGVYYVYDSGVLLQSITQTRYKTLIKNYSYDEDTLLEEITVTSPEQQVLLLTGAFLLDGAQTLSGSEELIFPHYQLNYDHERIYDGSKSYGEY